MSPPNIPIDKLRAVSETMAEELKQSLQSRRIQKKFPPHQRSTHTTIKHTTLDTIAADLLQLAEENEKLRQKFLDMFLKLKVEAGDGYIAGVTVDLIDQIIEQLTPATAGKPKT